MSGPAIFMLVWSVSAIGMGTFFALRPEVIEGLADRLGQRRGWSERARRFQVHLNRFGGVFLVVIGILFIVLVALGILPPPEDRRNVG